jgi:hypothetical protein
VKQRDKEREREGEKIVIPYFLLETKKTCKDRVIVDYSLSKGDNG